MQIGPNVCKKKHTKSLQSKLSVVFSLHEALEHVAATLGLS